MMHRKTANSSAESSINIGNAETDALLTKPEITKTKPSFFHPLVPERPSLLKLGQFVFACVVAAVVYNVTAIFPDQPSARRCLSLFMFVAIMWATEAIPLYSTSMLIPILIVSFEVLLSPTGQPLSPSDAASEVMATLFSGTVLVALGAFTMSLALSKYNLSYRLAVAILSRVGTRPPVVMLAVMVLGVFLSMFMNNVASPVVCVSIVHPLLMELGSKEVYSKVLLLGIAYSNNIGGMTSPISSPQNLVAVHTIQSTTWNTTINGVTTMQTGSIGWGSWLATGLPFALICTLLAWVFLWVAFRPTIKEVNPVPPRELEPFGIIHVVVLLVCLLTVVLWAIEKEVEGVFGDSGIIALIPVVVFFTLPILKKSDFKELSWDVLMLLSGGLALGNAIDNSGLLKIMANALADVVKDSNEWLVLLSFAGFIWVFGNFISHAVAAIIVLPVIAEVGCHLGGGNCLAGHYKLLVIGSVFIDSGAMSLPVTSFPNAQCFSVLDKDGNRFLSAFDFVKTGFILGIFELVLLMSVGYGLLRVVLD